VTGIAGITGDGTPFRLGGKALDPPGYDLMGAFVGSEGTLGVARRSPSASFVAPNPW